MSKPSYREALRIAKQVKLGLASGAEGASVRMTAEDQAKLYKKLARLQGDTPVDKANKLKYDNELLKLIGF